MSCMKAYYETLLRTCFGLEAVSISTLFLQRFRTLEAGRDTEILLRALHEQSLVGGSMCKKQEAQSVGTPQNSLKLMFEGHGDVSTT